MAFTLTLFVTPAKAQTGGEVGVAGQVSPRCWVVVGRTQSGISAEPSAMCNHGSPTTRASRRAPPTEVTLAAVETSTGLEELPARAVQEIVVSPRL